MRELLPDIDRWMAEGESLALATVTRTWRSAPRKVGAHMVVTQQSQMAGSVSGGCVEGAVAETAIQVLKSQRAQLLHFGVSDETAWDVGLACGGEMDVFVQPLDGKLYQFIRQALTRETAIAVATITVGEEPQIGSNFAQSEHHRSSYGTPSDEIQSLLENALAEETTQQVQLTRTGGASEVFINVLPPSPTLVLIGGVHLAMALSTLAKPLGYRNIIIDPRRAFANAERFPHADQIIQSWPDEALNQIQLNRSTAVATLTHDPKIDDPALIRVLNSPVFYIGSLGSRKTQAKRRKRLRDAGVAAHLLERIHGPIGLNIGAATPEEIALSIMAEIIAVQHSELPATEIVG